MIISDMNNKGFEAIKTIKETPYMETNTQKPLKTELNSKKKVDINILKARIQEAQTKESKKNFVIIILCLTVLGGLGTFLSI